MVRARRRAGGGPLYYKRASRLAIGQCSTNRACFRVSTSPCSAASVGAPLLKKGVSSSIACCSRQTFTRRCNVRSCPGVYCPGCLNCTRSKSSFAVSSGCWAKWVLSSSHTASKGSLRVRQQRGRLSRGEWRYCRFACSPRNWLPSALNTIGRRLSCPSEALCARGSTRLYDRALWRL
jgi:hypothetical protein